MPEEKPLVEQPTAAPTRKWTAVAIAEVLTGVAVVGALFGFQLSPEEVEAIAGGAMAVVIVVGRLVGYFTKNRAI